MESNERLADGETIGSNRTRFNNDIAMIEFMESVQTAYITTFIRPFVCMLKFEESASEKRRMQTQNNG